LLAVVCYYRARREVAKFRRRNLEALDDLICGNLGSDEPGSSELREDHHWQGVLQALAGWEALLGIARLAAQYVATSLASRSVWVPWSRLPAQAAHRRLLDRRL
jgi:hypothetical protein